jgi:hypothetical protein
MQHRDMDMLDGHTAWTSRLYTQEGHTWSMDTAWDCSIETGACSIDMNKLYGHGHAAWRWNCSTDINVQIDIHLEIELYIHCMYYGTVKNEANMDIRHQHGHAPLIWTCSIDIDM